VAVHTLKAPEAAGPCCAVAEPGKNNKAVKSKVSETGTATYDRPNREEYVDISTLLSWERLYEISVLAEDGQTYTPEALRCKPRKPPVRQLLVSRIIGNWNSYLFRGVFFVD
jgi:hypothetical protein